MSDQRSDPVPWLAGLAGFVLFPLMAKIVKVVRKPDSSRLVALPPGYEAGDEQPAPFGTDSFQQVDPEILGPNMYPFLISSITPRPIALISTVSKDGIGNVSPYSYFNIMAHDPPVLATGHVRRPADVPKDSSKIFWIQGESEISCLLIYSGQMDVPVHLSDGARPAPASHLPLMLLIGHSQSTIMKRGLGLQ